MPSARPIETAITVPRSRKPLFLLENVIAEGARGAIFEWASTLPYACIDRDRADVDTSPPRHFVHLVGRER